MLVACRSGFPNKLVDQAAENPECSPRQRRRRKSMGEGKKVETLSLKQVRVAAVYSVDNDRMTDHAHIASVAGSDESSVSRVVYTDCTDLARVASISDDLLTKIEQALGIPPLAIRGDGRLSTYDDVLEANERIIAERDRYADENAGLLHQLASMTNEANEKGDRIAALEDHIDVALNKVKRLTSDLDNEIKRRDFVETGLRRDIASAIKQRDLATAHFEGYAEAVDTFVAGINQ